MLDGTEEKIPWGSDDGPRVRQLRQLWGDGRSGGEIAIILGGGVTRAAVLAKLDRLGLLKSRGADVRTSTGIMPGRTAQINRPIKVTRRFVPATSTVLEASPLPPEPVDVPVHKRVKLIDLESHHCRWPIGDPKEQDFGFCGARKHAASMYCDAHFRASVAPPLGRSPNAEADAPRQSTMPTRRIA